ncbi:AAA domain-containing protein [Pleionea sediminis]|uniref:AAA domain-containing protein n=1 Tax=Pleionea sediminis TaxID=2569479 RepID=UPI001184E04F|nr:AAA domain-containing protein [Pleionea sediminis]
MTHKKTTDIKLTKKGDRRNQFSIRRFKNDHGFQVYELENTAEGRRIFIPRFIFGRFRAQIRNIVNTEVNANTSEPFEYATNFLNRDYFYFKSTKVDIENLIIQDIEEREGSSGYLTVSRRSLPALEALLYSEKLQHPNDVLDEIISYHKLFQFSFVKGSKSITSDLTLRKDVLQSIEKYSPRLAERVQANNQALESGSSKKKIQPGIGKKKKKTDSNTYQPKLGERFHEKNIEVDYDEIFGDSNISLLPKKESEDNNDSGGRKSKSSLSQFITPLSASNIKAFEVQKFSFELSSTESTEFRDRFIGDRSCDFYLGFEIVDALFTYNKAVKTFRFPLYYMAVSIRESGREIHVTAKNDGKIFLNHLALAHLVEKFSPTNAGTDPIDKFFNTLLAQDISIDRLNDRIHLSRYLPVKELIFDRSREILFGYQDENGKGGILNELSVNGIECDLQTVYLYRATKQLNPMEQALEKDLEEIQAIAHQSCRRFYQSLLGQFLTPEMASHETNNDSSKELTWIPGRPPKSTRSLINQLNRHNLLLLEGPPGTGKTHTIMNLLIHAISSKQRVLIVSDQQAAIEALTEKLLEYLIGDDKDTAAERQWKDLLFSAIKVVDQIETGEQSLPDLITQLTENFSVNDPGIGAGIDAKTLTRKLKVIQNEISHLTQKIQNQLEYDLGSDKIFSERFPQKRQRMYNENGLTQFLKLIFSTSAKEHLALESFIDQRLKLKQQGLDECYSYFKVNSENLASDIKALQDDERLLSKIIEAKVESLESFNEITKDHPHNELFRRLESQLEQFTVETTDGFKKVIHSIRARFRSPFTNEVKHIHQAVKSQIELLDTGKEWTDDLWSVLRDIHESIRINDVPTLELSLYLKNRGNNKTKKSRKTTASISIHNLLEDIDDLYRQQDTIVKDNFICQLRDIIRAATENKSSSGTNSITSIMAQVDHLKEFNSIAESGSVHEELKQTLSKSFPVWLVRKQAVPFLLPCIEQSFDLVIVDEATQCRVDDALSLMFRAKKMLVVGDDKQTVLQKDSIVDDYLFKDHELGEHLRSTQARGFKGGGSHIFGLVKSIKQGSVMLDEHYRCPADIIEFSNQNVYGNELKIMQWRLPETPPSVIINDDEKKAEQKKKPSSGKFKGIETAMIDRFMDYVAKTVKKLERETGKTINVETDVALCYFLMKNEPYVKSVKDKFLSQIRKGDDVLDGAGAALQGKERDYIFYLWDVTRYNMGAFKQGDDADKRKGELNVLMSRPKKKAFHYLHHGFESLDHSRTQITRYLWRTLLRQNNQSKNTSLTSDESASLYQQLLTFSVNNSKQRGLTQIQQNLIQQKLDFRKDIIVGDARYQVDLIVFPQGKPNEVVGIIDLSAFGIDPDSGQAVVDYYFQLKRAIPQINPLFTYPHEMINDNNLTFRRLIEKLDSLNID